MAVVDAPASVVKMVGRSVQLDAFLSVPYTYIYIYLYFYLHIYILLKVLEDPQLYAVY